MGWRVVALSGALYGTIYAYERLTWTNQVIEKILLNMFLELGNIFKGFCFSESGSVSPRSSFQFPLSQAKLKEFKRQYVDHAARKLRLIVDMTSANCSHQVRLALPPTI